VPPLQRRKKAELRASDVPPFVKVVKQITDLPFRAFPNAKYTLIRECSEREFVAVHKSLIFGQIWSFSPLRAMLPSDKCMVIVEAGDAAVRAPPGGGNWKLL
jgi:hypothetical protein